jgi:uncharacterized membrane protein
LALTLTLDGMNWRRLFGFLFGAGMIVASIMTIQHYYAANFPESIFEGSFCDISAFFNCDSSAYSVISQIGGVPLGYFGMFVGALVCLGTLLPSTAFERTNKAISLVNAVGVVVLASFSVFYLGSLCLLCSGYYLFSIASFALFWKYGIDNDEPDLVARYFNPSVMHSVVFGIVMLSGAYGFSQYHKAKEQAQVGMAAQVVEQYYSLPEVEWPSFISPFWTARATEEFADAPIQVVEFVDLLCPDCLFLAEQLARLKEEFAGQINIALQLFPLEGKCNDVVDKDLHPGACDVSYMAVYDSTKFEAIHDDIWANFRMARTPEGRDELARKYDVEAALTDSAAIELVHRMIATGREYEKTSDRYEHGIRSTPTMIVNNRMIIGTFPYEHLRAIFQALVDEREQGELFIERWVKE